MKDSHDALGDVLERIQTSCDKAGRAREAVQLIMVSKTISIERLEKHLKNSFQQHIFGENKAQELREKAAYFQQNKAAQNVVPEWHFIGALQSNKIKDMLPYTTLLHSLDRLSLAKKLQNKLATIGQSLSVLIQVNAAREDSKSGVLPEDALAFVKQIDDGFPNLNLQGFMTIGAHTSNEVKVRDSFKRLVEIREQAQGLDLKNKTLPHLSMGMSGDFEWAIEEGATLVRVGSAIFGARS